jgi:hypothetical protein
MSKENEIDLNVIEDVEALPDFTPTVDENGNDTTDWKAQAEANLELAKKYQGIGQRNKTRLQKLKEAQEADKNKNTPATRNEPSNDLGEKAYLIANGIKGAEIEFVKKLQKETGKDVETLLGTTYFQTELKAFRDKATTDGAVPSSSKRSQASSVDSVEYWLAKGELPPKDQVKLRQDVVNARMKSESSKTRFYNS